CYRDWSSDVCSSDLLVGQEPVAELAEVFLQERVIVDLRLLGKRLLFLLGLRPQADFVGLGLEGLAAGADRGDVPGRARGGEEGCDQDPCETTAGRAPAVRRHAHRRPRLPSSVPA